MYRTLLVLTPVQALAQSGVPIVVLLGGIIGTRLAPAAELATLPVALVVVGTALTTVPAALIMHRFGRKAGFLFGTTYACASGLVAAYAVHIESFWLFCAATFFVGSHNAFIQQYRFAVAESVPPERVAKALSVLMLAGVVAAYVGPATANRLHDWLPFAEFTGSFVGLSILMAGAFVLLLLFYRNLDPAESNVERRARPLASFATQPLFLFAVGSAVVAYGVMSLIMTATPVSMHVQDHFTLEDTTWVVQSHIMAMFLPSLVSGALVSRFGPRRMIACGFVLLLICLAIGYANRNLVHYWFTLVFLGVGWNFMFLGGTTLLTQLHEPAERFRVQALNDFLVFGLQAVASLSSGMILAHFGWNGVLGLSVPWLFALLAVMGYSARSR